MHPNLTRALRLFGLLETGRRAELRMRMAQDRALPDAVIIGAQKCGTSSLHNYLSQHPAVIPPLRKEVHYFDVNFKRGDAWYRAHFGRQGATGLNFDASPYYVFHPLAAERMHALLPHAKLIVLLRDPVRRAYSQYWHERDKGRERLSFEDALEAEPDRVDGAHRRLAHGEIEASREHQIHSYVTRGRYAEQLERWLALYPREQLLVLRFEDLVKDPLAVLNRTLGYLGLSAMAGAKLEPRNSRNYPPMNPATAERLKAYFAPENARLEAMMGELTGW